MYAIGEDCFVITELSIKGLNCIWFAWVVSKCTFCCENGWWGHLYGKILVPFTIYMAINLISFNSLALNMSPKFIINSMIKKEIKTIASVFHCHSKRVGTQIVL
jgi:hypothetical protein